MCFSLRRASIWSRSRCPSCAASLSHLASTRPSGHRIADRFFSLGSIMSRVILLIVCALSVASCLVMQTGAMRSAGERPPQPLFPFPRVPP